MMIAGGVIGGKLPISVLVDHATTESDVGGTYNFTDRQLGEADSSRLLVLALRAEHAGSSLNPVNSCSLGGQSASFIAGTTGSSSSSTHMWAAHVPAGTTGTVSFSRPGSMIAASWVLWAVYNLKSHTPTPTPVFDPFIGHPKASGVNVQSGGVCLGFAYVVLQNAPVTWTGLMEDVDAASANGGSRYSGASANKLSAASPHEVTVSNTGSQNSVLLLASWR